MTDKHHYQRIDVENGCVQITRDDTDETQELRINAYGKDGTLIKSARHLYNIKYDYFRRQTWKGAALIQDEIPLSYGYGHLQWEFSLQLPPDDWVNPYPDNYEPVKPEGADMFHREGLNYGFICYELNIKARVNFYIWDDLEEWIKQEMNLLKENGVDFVVLARYMQIISEDMINHYPNKIINIHHSFLPAFIGAKPYHQAFERGVKIIGATSHYVTTELDAGPIIEQDVARVTHKDTVKSFVHKGEDLEKIVLSRAVEKHIDRKVLVYKNKTIVFS